MPIVMTVDQRAFDKAIQISINKKDADGSGHGFRIAGPKYDGNGKTLLSKTLTKRDADEIISYLKQITE